MNNKDLLKPTIWAYDKFRQDGSIILLNGTSSAGKGSIATELLKILTKPYVLFSLDNFLSDYKFNNDEESCSEYIKNIKGYYLSVLSFYNEGNNIIVDTVFQDGIYDYKYTQSIFSGKKIIYIAVKCSLEELKKREINRGNRHIGLAEFQYYRVHNGVNYDYEVDTTIHSPEKCAANIIEYINNNENKN